MGNENVRNIGFEDRIQAVLAIAPRVINDATPVLSAAIDTNSYGRSRILLMVTNKETTATAHTIDFTVTESATSGGTYAAATTSGTITTLSADGVQFASIKRNKAKPFIKITATGSHVDVDVICSAAVLFIKDGT